MDNIINILNNEIIQGNFSFILLLLAFIGGVLSSVSPCNLAILPLVIGYVGGYGAKDNKKNFIQMIFFVVGLSVTLAIVGVVAGAVGTVFKSFFNVYWILFLASIFFIMGLYLLGLIDIYMPPLVKELPKNENNSMIIIPLFVGLIFGFATTPCATPILISIIGLASVSKNVLFAAAMLFMFSLGEGLIIILAASFTSFLKNLKSAIKISEIITKLSAFLLIGTALTIYYIIFSQLTLK